MGRMRLNILRNLEIWKDKNKTAFVIEYVLQILHRPFIAVLGMFSIRRFSLTVSKVEL